MKALLISMPERWAPPWLKAEFLQELSWAMDPISVAALQLWELHGKGKEVISIGKKTLLGANSGLGISLGDECVLEAGVYLTAGSKITSRWKDN
jgi:hypothetical protein